MGQNFIDMALGLFSSLLGNKEAKVEVTIPIDAPKPAADAATPTDWTDPKCQLTAHFTVGDALTLHAWNRLADATDDLTDQIKANLTHLCQLMEQVREILGCPMNVHCMYRSPKYNQEVVKAIPHDVHSMGLAIDFDCGPHLTIEQVKEKMLPVLDKLGIRMEKGTTTWVHLDFHSVGPSGRYFTA